MNFVGVLVGGIAVAYALVELLPAEVLSPPDEGPVVAMVIALLASALFFTCWRLRDWDHKTVTWRRAASTASG